MKKLSVAKKIFLSLILVFSFLFVANIATIYYNSVKALTSYYGTNSISITNGDFTSFSKNSNKLPYSISSGWTSISDSEGEVYSGIIDTDSTVFADNDSFTLQSNPETYKSTSEIDSKILMIKAKNNEVGTKYGYQSSVVTLSANKYYVVIVRAKTGLLDADKKLISETDATASIYTGLTDDTKFKYVNTSGNWFTYKIFIATDLYSSSSLSLKLKLGNNSVNSTGVVFFDNIEILEIANSDYYDEEATPSVYKEFINLKRNEEVSFTNSDFENNLDGYTVINGSGNVSTPLLSSISSTIEEANGANNFVYQNNKSLFINNKTKTITTVSSADNNTINIKQHNYYYLTLLIKTGSLSSDGLNITLNEKVASGEPITASQTGLTSSNESKEYNGFSLVSFYIRGNTNKDSSVGITFSLGTSETPVSGYAIIDNIKLYKINQNEYSNNSSSNVLDLAKNVSEISSIKNGSFDFITGSYDEITYPVLPQDWTYSNFDYLSGIIRVNSKSFAKDCLNFDLYPEQNPGPNTSYSAYVENGYVPTSSQTDQNVLMVRETSDQDAFFISSSFSLTTNSSTDSSKINKVEVAIKTLNSSKAFISLINEDYQTLAVIDNIISNDWATYTIYIKNGLSATNVRLVLGVKGNNNNNYAFFDFAKFTETVDLSISEILNKENSCYVDLITDSFYSHSNDKNSYNVYEVSNWSEYEIDQTSLSAMYNGIVYAPNISELNVREGALDKNLLVFTNIGVNGGYQILNSNYLYSIKKGNYYEFSVYVKTELNANLNTDKYGAYFELATVDSETEEISVLSSNKNKFVNIVSSSEDNNWEKYSIYVYAEEDQTVSVLLGLGTEEYPTIGKVYFDDLTVCPISEEEYLEKTESSNTIISKVLASSKDTSTSNANSTYTNSTSSNPINIFVLFSSIILGIALVLAIAGYLIRRIPKRSMAKIEKSDYNVKPTSINEATVKQELKKQRDSQINNLTLKLNELKKQRDNIIKEYDEKSSNEDNVTLKENIYKTYTKKINKLTKDIDYIESALVFNKDDSNIKTMENIEIKKKQKESVQEFLTLKNKKEVKKNETEEKPKKSKGKKFNPNKIKK